MPNRRPTRWLGWLACLLVLATTVASSARADGGGLQAPLPPGISLTYQPLTIPTAGYEAALLPPAANDAIYPYPRLDWDAVESPQPRTYNALVLENAFLQLTFLPELGGRLYQVVDKATGQPLFYQNPVILPSPFGQRGWWLAAGGMEWALPTEEHGYLEYLPWAAFWTTTNDQLAMQMRNTERQTGMVVTSTVTLRRDERRFTVALEVHNPTSEALPLQMWLNAMLAPGGGNRVGAGLHFVFPTDTAILHAAQDSRVPAPNQPFAWPNLAGVDLSYPARWDGYIGAFAPEPIPFMGVYDTAQDAGVAVVQGRGATGAKLFGFSPTFDRGLFTTDDSDYVELWSGAQPTFWDNPLLAPGATRRIATTWLPVHGLGDLRTASTGGALGTVQQPDGSRVLVLSVAQPVPDARIRVQVAGQEVVQTPPRMLAPDTPVLLELPADAAGKPVQVTAPGVRLVLDAF